MLVCPVGLLVDCLVVQFRAARAHIVVNHDNIGGSGDTVQRRCS